MRVLDLFSGIGGFSLGLERAGFTTVAFCEIEPYCRAVLKKHWPDVPCYDDVRTLTIGRLAADGICVDVICGGFPCQDISVAGKGAGLAGERSGLWSEYSRLIGELRPRYAIVENVAALLGRGMDTVLGDLASLGYDAEWHCIPASAVGAPHRRDRIWIVAYPDASQRWAICGSCGRMEGKERLSQGEKGSSGPKPGNTPLANTDSGRPAQHAGCECEIGLGVVIGSEAMANTNTGDEHGRRRTLQVGWGGIASKIAHDGDIGRTQWGVEPDVGRVAHGISRRVDRLEALGNAVVPQIPEMIGRAIMAAEAA